MSPAGFYTRRATTGSASRVGEVGHGPLQTHLAMLVHGHRHQLFRECVGVDVPARGEQKTVVPIHPHVLEFQLLEVAADAAALRVAGSVRVGFREGRS